MGSGTISIMLPIVALLLLLCNVSAQYIITSEPVNGEVAQLDINENPPLFFQTSVTLNPDVESFLFMTKDITLYSAGTNNHQVQTYEIVDPTTQVLIPNTTCAFETPMLFEVGSTDPKAGRIFILPLYPVGTHNFWFLISTTLSVGQLQTTFPVDVTVIVNPKINSPFTINAPQGSSYDVLTDRYSINVRENTTITFSFSLSSQPGQNTEFAFSGSVPGSIITPTSYSWTPGMAYADWSAEKVVTIEIPHDGLITGNYTIDFNTVVTGDPYPFPAITLNVENIDLVEYFFSKSSFNLMEGSSETFTVYVRSKPTDPITMTFPSHTLFKFEPAFIIIDPTTYEVPQTVTFSIPQNNVVLGTVQFVDLDISITTADTAYAAAPLPKMSITIQDDDIVMLSMTPSIGIDDGEYDTLIQLSADVTLDVTRLIPTPTPYLASVDVSGVAPLEINVAAPDLTVVDGNLIATDSPYYPFRNSSVVGTYNGVPNVFIRTFYCRFGDTTNFKLTAATIKGPRTISCYVPPCTEDPLDVSVKCITPLPFYLIVSSQAALQSLSYTYMWGPQHDVIDPLKFDPADEVWRSIVTTASPEYLDSREETWLTMDAYHMAVRTDRKLVAQSIPEAVPKCRIDGFVSREAYYIDPNDHSKGFRCLAPKRIDLAGSNSVIRVTLEVSAHAGQAYFKPYGINIGYFDFRKERDSNAWTYFFIGVNLGFLLYFLYLMKDVVCVRLCKRCRKEEEKEAEELLDIRGPKPVSEYLKKRIEEMLSDDERALRELKYLEAIDKEDDEKLRAAGYMTQAEVKQLNQRKGGGQNPEDEDEKIQSALRARAARQPYLAHQLRKDLHKVSNGGVTPGGAVVVDHKLVGASHTHQQDKSIREEDDMHGTGVVGASGSNNAAGAGFHVQTSRNGSAAAAGRVGSGAGDRQEVVQMSDLRQRANGSPALENGQGMRVGSGGVGKGFHGVELTPMK